MSVNKQVYSNTSFHNIAGFCTPGAYNIHEEFTW